MQVLYRPISNIGPIRIRAPKAAEQARSNSGPDGVKGDLNQASVSLGLVLFMFVVSIKCCLGFFASSLGCSYICFASGSQVVFGQKDRFLAPLKRLAGKIVSKLQCVD